MMAAMLVTPAATARLLVDRFTPMMVPILVRREAMVGTGFLPGDEHPREIVKRGLRVGPADGFVQCADEVVMALAVLVVDRDPPLQECGEGRRIVFVDPDRVGDRYPVLQVTAAGRTVRASESETASIRPDPSSATRCTSSRTACSTCRKPQGSTFMS